jgi:hypothetical protein
MADIAASNAYEEASRAHRRTPFNDKLSAFPANTSGTCRALDPFGDEYRSALAVADQGTPRILRGP